METALLTVLHLVLLLLAPLPLLGLVGRVKAIAAGRRGPPILQPAWDLAKLLRKGAVYSRTTTWVFVAGPVVALATTLAAGLMVPFACPAAPLAFPGDLFVVVALLALGRYFTMAAALDTGSAFEGMGASREAAFSALAEPALFLSLLVLALPTGALSFGQAYAASHAGPLGTPVMVVAAVAVGIVLLAETARIPVDDPNTHLELTMIHEVMILDHSGPDLAFLLYAYALKLFVLSAVLVRFVVPMPADLLVAVPLFLAAQAAVAVAIGLIESGMARLRLTRVPQFLIGASVVATIALVALYAGGRP